MPDILISGMAMPTTCGECNLCWSIFSDSGYICRATKSPKRVTNIFDRLEDCPLHELPPHGDLIDRDEALDSLLDGMVMTGYQTRAMDCIRFYTTVVIPSNMEDQQL